MFCSSLRTHLYVCFISVQWGLLSVQRNDSTLNVGSEYVMVIFALQCKSVMHDVDYSVRNDKRTRAAAAIDVCPFVVVTIRPDAVFESC